MDNSKTLLTQSGFKKLQDELEHLKVNRRKEIAEKIKEARAQGDLSEKNADVVEETLDDDRVNIGCRVTILDIEFDEEMVFDLVGSSEANSLKGSISNESPVGKALMGREVGDLVSVETQAGEIQYKILKVERSAT